MQVVYFLVKTHIASLVAFQIVISCLAKSSKLVKRFIFKKGSHKPFVQKKTKWVLKAGWDKGQPIIRVYGSLWSETELKRLSFCMKLCYYIHFLNTIFFRVWQFEIASSFVLKLGSNSAGNVTGVCYRWRTDFSSLVRGYLLHFQTYTPRKSWQKKAFSSW